MTLGGGHRMVRCKEKPDFIATERVPGADGKRGSMSVCAACRVQMEKQLGGDFATFKALKA